MAENQKTYGLPNLSNLLSMGLESAIDLGLGTGKSIYGGASDITGILNELLGGPKSTSDFFRQKASDLYDSSVDSFKDVLDPQTMGERFRKRVLTNPRPNEEDLRKKFIAEDLTAGLFGDIKIPTEGRPQTIEEELKSLTDAVSPKVPPGGRPQTIAEEKEKSVADLQEEVKANEQLFGREKEAFRKEEEGRLQGTPTTPENIDQINEDAFKIAMEDFMNKAGKGKATKGAGTGGGGRSLEDYKKEFAKATGINIEGGPDKSNFLMALGLGLMQNRAGKNFDISKILTSVGEATEKAMPKLEEAKKKFDAEQLAAGQYALKAQAKDRATAAAAQKKLNETKDYFVVPTDGKGGLTPALYAANVDKARLMSFSNADINSLKNDENFNNNFAILPAENFHEIAKEALETPEGKDKYRETPTKVKLFKNAEAGSMFEVNVAMINPNNPDMVGKNPLLLQNPDEIYRSFARMYKDNQKMKDKFVDLGILTEDNRNVFTYTADKINSLMAAFQIKFSEDETESDKIIRILENLAMKKAPDILGESGKTISDADRERVERIVGQLQAFGDIRTQRARIQDLFNDIVIGAESDIIEGITNLDRYANRNVAKTLFGTDSGSLIGKDAEDLIRLKNKFGIK